MKRLSRWREKEEKEVRAKPMERKVARVVKEVKAAKAKAKVKEKAKAKAKVRIPKEKVKRERNQDVSFAMPQIIGQRIALNEIRQQLPPLLKE